MARIVEGEPGQQAEVWVQDRGSSEARLRGHIVIEDLRHVLTSISSRTGANGPQNPVTQYILARAADYLAERIVDDGAPAGDGRELVPRTLSGTLGHQPFIETVLNMSQHQMLRRWPLATDWYRDVINYVMRPSRSRLKSDSVLAHVDEWTQAPFGEFIQKLAHAIMFMDEDPKTLRMAEALQSLWPDYPPVREAMLENRRRIEEVWSPLYEEIMRRYGFVLRPEATLSEVVWGLNALRAREIWEHLADPHLARQLAEAGSAESRTVHATLMLVCGAVTDQEGRSFTISELLCREPVVQP